jgi:hypothetical protein
VLIAVASAGVLAVVFVTAIVGKARPSSFGAYREAVVDLWPGRRRLPSATARALAYLFLAGEVVAVATLPLCLVGPPALRAVPFTVAGLLLLAFTVGQVAVLARGESVGCACFGRTSSPVTKLSAGRNLVLIAIALAGASGAAAGGRIDWPAAVLAVVAGAVVGLFAVALDDIVALFRVPSVR